MPICFASTPGMLPPTSRDDGGSFDLLAPRCITDAPEVNNVAEFGSAVGKKIRSPGLIRV